MNKKIIPNYILQERCGQGGSAEVWIAEDHHGMKCAIRLFPKKTLPGRVNTERHNMNLYCEIAGHHTEHLLHCLQTGETEEYLYYVTELADNVQKTAGLYHPDTMAWRIRHHQDRPGVLIQYMLDLLDGVAHLHDAGVAHNDLKPENVLFIQGILKLGDPELIEAVRSPGTGGTYDYHPEWKASGMEADIYAAGIILYCLFTKKDPSEFPSLSANLNFSLFYPVNEIILRCCESSPVYRYKNVTEIIHDLKILQKQDSLQRIFI